MNSSKVAQYMIGFGAEIDNSSLNQLLTLMDTTKLRAYGLSAAFVGITTAVFKFIESTTKEELALRELNKTKKKTLETLRAEEQAVKSMGKTLDEIKKDKALKETYNEIVKFNKEMALPNIDKAVENVNKLKSEFWKLKSAIGYAVQAIGNQVLTNLEAPIRRITGYLGNISDWIKKNLNHIASRVGSYLTAFAKGLIGITETLGKIIKWVGELPSGIKAIGTAVAALIAMFSMGPLGKIITAIEMIGDLIHDYENYEWNKENANPNDPNKDGTIYLGEDGKFTKKKPSADATPYKIPIALESVWELKDGVEEAGGGLGEFATGLIEKLTTILNESLQGIDIGELLGGNPETGKPGLISEASAWLRNNTDKLTEFGNALIGFCSRAIATGGGLVGGAAGQLLTAIFGDGVVSEELFTGDGSAGASFAGFIGGFIKEFTQKLNDKDASILDAVKQGLVGGTFGSILTAIFSNIDQGKIQWEQVGDDLLYGVGESLLGIFDVSIGKFSEMGGSILNVLGSALVGTKLTGTDVDKFLQTVGGVFTEWSKNKTLTAGIVTSLSTALMGGNVIESLAGGIVGAFTVERENAMRNALKKAGNIPEKIIDSLQGASLQKEYNRLDDSFKSNYWSDIFSGLGDAGASLIEGLWTSLVEGAKTVSGLSSQLMDMLIQGLYDILVPENGTDVQLEDNAIVSGLGTAIGARVLGANFLESLVAGILSTVVSLQEQVGEGKKYANLWEALKGEAAEFWKQIEDIWLGPEVNGERQSEKGIESIFAPMFEEIGKAATRIWEGDNGDGGIKSSFKKIGSDIFHWIAQGLGADEEGGWSGLFQQISTEILTFFSGLVGSDIEDGWKGIFVKLGDDIVNWLTPAFNQLGNVLSVALYNALESSGILGALSFLGVNVNNPNTSTIERDANGNAILKSTNGRTKALTPEEAEFFTKNKSFTNANGSLMVSIDKNGNIVGSQDYSQMDNNAFLANLAFYGAMFGFDVNKPIEPAEFEFGGQKYRVPVGKNGKYDWDSLERYYSDEEMARKFFDIPGNYVPDVSPEGRNYLRNQYESGNIELPELPPQNVDVEPNVNTGSIQTQINEHTFTAKVEPKVGGGLFGAEGGRYQSATPITIGEDGTEYLIPITKPERAFALINQMLSEMGSSAISRIFSGLGIGGGGTNGASSASVASALSGMSMVNNYNISAPVNIHVNSNGADAKEIGTSVYDMAERHLIKNLMGVYG